MPSTRSRDRVFKGKVVRFFFASTAGFAALLLANLKYHAAHYSGQSYLLIPPSEGMTFLGFVHITSLFGATICFVLGVVFSLLPESFFQQSPKREVPEPESLKDEPEEGELPTEADVDAPIRKENSWAIVLAGLAGVVAVIGAVGAASSLEQPALIWIFGPIAAAGIFGVVLSLLFRLWYWARKRNFNRNR